MAVRTTGECDARDENYSGFAINPAQKIAEESGLDEILVSRTIKDLVAGSGIVFQEYGVKSFGSAR